MSSWTYGVKEVFFNLELGSGLTPIKSPWAVPQIHEFHCMQWHLDDSYTGYILPPTSWQHRPLRSLISWWSLPLLKGHVATFDLQIVSISAVSCESKCSCINYIICLQAKEKLTCWILTGESPRCGGTLNYVTFLVIPPDSVPKL